MGTIVYPGVQTHVARSGLTLPSSGNLSAANRATIVNGARIRGLIPGRRYKYSMMIITINQVARGGTANSYYEIMPQFVGSPNTDVFNSNMRDARQFNNITYGLTQSRSTIFTMPDGRTDIGIGHFNTNQISSLFMTIIVERLDFYIEG